MTTGRTTIKHYRLYADGYDLSGWGRSIGPLSIEHDEADLTAWTDTVKGYLKNFSRANIGNLNAIFDNIPSTGSFDLLKQAGIKRSVLVAMGIQAPPANGDPVFLGQFAHSGLQEDNDNGAVILTAKFDGVAADAASLLYCPGWGQLLHANGAETAPNTATGIDNEAQATQTTKGGLFMYQVLAGDGTATLKVQDAATNSNPSFADITGATSGLISCNTPTAGMVALANNQTIRRYLRWQIVLGTATTVTFVSAFMRAWHYTGS